ncbi:feruloyl esterase-like protein [Punctularia strigosozonata HHB-11173 SS5]|uniref:Carboxylic ester hydrolase n=1 Tax=Punctularia strigosozonata (strain HHB-11173) TaxID=741275 RepID=R7S1I8_PUNST|nr:feruloyl esterase-like protein [Punctularia strigosozonata HHB-11173 SS5]EIN04093.1 feruloyl esterase-like protein [Punctularia strigosozonata HHB-11173 SS5]
MKSLLLLALASTTAPLARAWGAERCASFTLKESGVAPVSAFSAQFYDAGDFVNVTNPFSSINTTSLPAFCRIQVAIVSNQTAGSVVNTEVWLPEAWTGRFLTVGNGGYAGGATVEDLGYVGVAQGFAGVSTDTGHVSTAGGANWTLGDVNAITDWSWRAIRLSVLIGKETVEQYYNQKITKSYYLGCSTGGRQGLIEVQRFPTDFDGVLIGSPSNWMTHLQPWGLHVGNLVQPVNSSRWIPAETWAGLIHNEVLRQCDGLDGVNDGILNDPTACHFDPSPITCAGGTLPDPTNPICLSADQADAVTKVLSDYYAEDGSFVFNGYYPGGEVGYPTGYVANVSNVYAIDYERYFVMNDSMWNATSLNVDVIRLGDELDVGRTNAIDPDIRPFVNAPHNGKILHYVGLADQLISPGNSKLYHQNVAGFMAQHGRLDVDDFYRLFTVPGMQHWYGGFGANAFGASRQASLGMTPLSHSPENDIVQALVAWVEHGRAPTQLIAASWVNNSDANGLAFTRPICKFPLQVKYKGGNPNVASSFFCG